MEKAKEDQWIQSPSSVISTVTISPGTCGSFISGVCGFGWRFRAELLTHDVRTKSKKKSYRKPQSLRLRIDPNLIAKADFGEISITVQSSGVEYPGSNDFTFSLPIAPYTAFGAPLADYPLGEYDLMSSYDSYRMYPTFKITVMFSKSLDLAFPSLSSDITLPVVDRTALLDRRIEGIMDDIATGLELVDTKFYLYSRRTEQGVACPLVMFASSRYLMGHLEYLDTLLHGDGFKDSTIVNIDAHTMTEDVVTRDYDYESDSDLDYEDDEEIEGQEPSSVAEVRTSTSSLPPGQASASGYESSSSLADTSNDTVSMHLADKQIQDESSCRSRTVTMGSGNRMGRVIILEKWAYRTWRSLIMYLYTGKIWFSTIGSRERSNMPWSCSPKSMYRLAHEAQHEELKRLSLQAIQEQLTAQNIVEQVLSRFTSWFDEVGEIETQFFCDNFDNIPNFRESDLLTIVKDKYIIKSLMMIIQKLGAMQKGKNGAKVSGGPSWTTSAEREGEKSPGAEVPPHWLPDGLASRAPSPGFMY